MQFSGFPTTAAANATGDQFSKFAMVNLNPLGALKELSTSLADAEI